MTNYMYRCIVSLTCVCCSPTMGLTCAWIALTVAIGKNIPDDDALAPPAPLDVLTALFGVGVMSPWPPIPSSQAIRVDVWYPGLATSN